MKIVLRRRSLYRHEKALRNDVEVYGWRMAITALLISWPLQTAVYVYQVGLGWLLLAAVLAAMLLGLSVRISATALVVRFALVMRRMSWVAAQPPDGPAPVRPRRDESDQPDR